MKKVFYIFIVVFTTFAFAQNINDLRTLCDRYDTQNCVKLGLAYEHGNGVKENKVKAAELYKKACENNNSLGCLSLSMMYQKANSMPQDSNLITNLLKDCALNSRSGCFWAGLIYKSGVDVEEDTQKAKEYFAKSCALELKDGCAEYIRLFVSD
ncbi:MAG: sel1 repeat family protein [Campylobacteraceae bacterium]|jgi:TPR repeat protein|nr:sel1 repeat family protein [Campylobacteraceae bacterium]